jgi:hypothetical protein
MLLLQRTVPAPPAAAAAAGAAAPVLARPEVRGLGGRLLLAGTTRGWVEVSARPKARATLGFCWEPALSWGPVALAAERVSTPARCSAAAGVGVVLALPRCPVAIERLVVYLGVVVAFSLPAAAALGFAAAEALAELAAAAPGGCCCCGSLALQACCLRGLLCCHVFSADSIQAGADHHSGSG